MLNAKLWPGYWSEGQVFRMGQEFFATLWTQYWRVGARPRFSPSAGTLKQCGCHPERSEASQLFAPRMEADGWRLVLVGIEDGTTKRKKRAATRGTPSHIARKFLCRSELLLFFGRLIHWWGGRCLRRGRRLRRAGHTVLEASDAFAKPLHNFRDALAAKENQDHSQNNEPMKNTKFTHETPPRAPRLAAR